MTGTRGRGIHHLWAVAATGVLLWSAPPLTRSALAQATPGAVAGNSLPFQASAEQPSALTQTGVPAEATAENAVIARDRALAGAQRIAYERMAEALGLPKGIDSAQLDQLVSSVVIEQERTSRTSYSGRVTVNFNPDRVRDASGGRLALGAAPGAPAGPLLAPASAFLDVKASFLGGQEWFELRRRLLANPMVANVDIRAIAVDGARLRLGLRGSPAQATGELGLVGIRLGPAQPTPGQPTPGQPADNAWRLSLAGGA